MNPARPYNAVGYLDNGCSATLIGLNHILAAGHCFGGAGVWATTNLQFYPNFHPSRVPYSGAPNVPRMDVTRAVVGERVYGIETGNDWGIAYVTNPQDTTGLDLTPATLWGTSVANPVLTQVGYPRAFFVNGGGANPQPPTYDMPANVHWWIPGSSCDGQWVIDVAAAPANETPTTCNQRWQYGLINYTPPPNNCTVTNWDSGSTGSLAHNCDATGGNSGSALLAPNPAQGNELQLVGVHSATSVSNFNSNPPIACDSNPNSPNQNYGVATTRFIYAPRFATNVAVARRPGGDGATAVFAADKDTTQVKMRMRLGTTPNFASPFNFWANTGTVGSALSQLGSVAACNQTPTNPTPRVFALSYFLGSSALYSSTPWTTGWSDFSLPGSGGATDVDADREAAAGRCQVYVVRGGALYTKWMTSETQWSGWATVQPANGYTRVTAGNTGGVFFVMMLDNQGRLWWTKYAGGWSAPALVAFPGGVSSWTDIDLGYGHVLSGSPNLVLYLYSNAGNNQSKIWKRTIPSTGSWGPWTSFSTTLYCPTGSCPGGVDPPPPTLATITASHWMEDAPSQTTPAVFGTDTFGNVYHLNNTAVGDLGTRWHSAYSRYIPQ